MHYIIYKVTNKLNGKIYIGSHKTKQLDDGYMGSGTYLKRAIKKYGLVNFTKEIIHDFDTAEKMYAKEAEIVNEDFLMNENTYNMKVGGFGGFDWINQNSSVRKKYTPSLRKATGNYKKGHASQTAVHDQKILEYERCPIYCLVCGKALTYEQNLNRKEGSNPFCSRSHAVSFNNKGKTRNIKGLNQYSLVV